MKRPLILHIGLSKTGSSSIQRVLANQRAALAAQGVYLPTSPGWANHALLPAAMVNDLKILWGYHPATWEGLSQSARIARFREEFVAEMNGLTDDVKRILITAEQIGGVLREPDEVQRLADFLAPYTDDVQVVVYLRRQDQHATSAYSEWLRSGTVRPARLPDGGPAQHPEYDYGGLLARWAAAFGSPAMRPRIFARETLRQGDVVADFLELANISLPPLEDDPKRLSNPSVNVAGQNLLAAAGLRCEQKAPGTLWRDSPGWRRLAESVTEIFPGRGWRPTQSEARDFMARFAATNEAVRKLYFPQSASLFTEDFSDLPEKPAAGGQAQVTEAALDLMLHEVAVSAEREALAAMAQYRLNRRLADRPAMRACLVRAVKFSPNLLAARLRLAEYFLEEGDRRQAAEHVAAAQRIAPGDPNAERLEKRLKK